MIAILRRKIATWHRIAPQRRWFLLEAICWLAIARAWLLVTPFRNVAKHLGAALPAGQKGQAVIGDVEADLARDIGWAVRIAARIVPFRAVCLQQGIAGKLMLRRRSIGSTLHFGVARGNAEKPGISAHAWLDASGVKVTGYPVGPDFAEVACFI